MRALIIGGGYVPVMGIAFIAAAEAAIRRAGIDPTSLSPPEHEAACLIYAPSGFAVYEEPRPVRPKASRYQRNRIYPNPYRK